MKLMSSLNHVEVHIELFMYVQNFVQGKSENCTLGRQFLLQHFVTAFYGRMQIQQILLLIVKVFQQQHFSCEFYVVVFSD